jgi:hypothetical protein
MQMKRENNNKLKGLQLGRKIVNDTTYHWHSLLIFCHNPQHIIRRRGFLFTNEC